MSDEATCSTLSIKVEKETRKSIKMDSSKEELCDKKKYEHSDLHDLSGYNKKQILNYLKSNGCNAKMFQEALRKFKVSRESAVEYFQNHIDGAEAHVYQECESFCFKNINDWLKLFKDCELMDACNYEHAIVMNAIANNERQPSPSHLGGVDLGEIYEFLAKSLMGLPQNELNKESAEFLAAEFELLIEEANTENGDKETRLLKTKLQTTPSKRATQLSLDPLQLQPETFTMKYM